MWRGEVGNRIGHQGLRFERYDTPWFGGSGGAGGLSGATGPLTHASAYPIGAPQTIPADAYTPVHGQYHNRNRMYSPALGRFLSRDPNALGTPVLSDLSFGGMAVEVSDEFPSIGEHFADGINSHLAYGGNPLTRTDALGLYDSENLYEDITDTLGLLDPIPGPSDYIREVLRQLVTVYSENLEWDLDWASDWNLSDDEHSRGDSRWVQLAMLQGLHDAFDIDLPFTDETFNPLDTLAVAGNRAPDGGGGGGKVKVGKGAREFLQKIGLGKVQLRGRGYESGKRQLLEAGFEYDSGRRSGGHTFVHPQTKAKVSWDPPSKGARRFTPPGALGPVRNRSHWHIEYGGNRYDVNGVRQVDRHSGPAHIPSSR